MHCRREKGRPVRSVLVDATTNRRRGPDSKGRQTASGIGLRLDHERCRKGPGTSRRRLFLGRRMIAHEGAGLGRVRLSRPASALVARRCRRPVPSSGWRSVSTSQWSVCGVWASAPPSPLPSLPKPGGSLPAAALAVVSQCPVLSPALQLSAVGAPGRWTSACLWTWEIRPAGGASDPFLFA